MLTDLFGFIIGVFSKAWDVFMLTIPGTNFTFGALGITLLLVDVGFRLFSYLSGAGFGVGVVTYAFKGVSQRGGNNKNIRRKTRKE